MIWHYLPDAASASVQAAADLTWALNLPSRALPPPPMLNGKTTLGKPSSPPSAPDTLPLPRSGTTSKHSAATRGAASLTPSPPAIHASRFPKRDNVAAQTTPDTYGPMSPASSANVPRDGFSLKTSRATPASAQRPYCESYGEWVSRLRLAYSLRKKQARHMNGCAGSALHTARAWTTPQAHDVTARGSGQKTGQRHAGNRCLPTDAQNWPTPMAGTPAQNGNSAAGNNDFTRKAEAMALALWGTPRASDAEKGGPNQAFGTGGTPLPAQAANWPTPAARDQKGSSPGSVTRRDGKSRLDMLDFAAEQAFTPPGPTTSKPGVEPRPTYYRLLRYAMRRHGRTITRRLWRSRDKRRLNPLFVSWLMCFPPDHLFCASLATPSCPSQRPTHGKRWQGRTGYKGSLNDTENMRSLRRYVSSRTAPEQILLQKLLQREPPDGTMVRPDTQGRDADHRTQGGNGNPSRTTTQDERTRPPQERQQARQSNRKLGSFDHSRAFQPASQQTSEGEAVRMVWERICAACENAGEVQDLLEALPLPVSQTHPAFASYIIWQRDMRGALSQLPTASGQWIWKPTDRAKPPKQLEMF